MAYTQLLQTAGLHSLREMSLFSKSNATRTMWYTFTTCPPLALSQLLVTHIGMWGRNTSCKTSFYPCSDSLSWLCLFYFIVWMTRVCNLIITIPIYFFSVTCTRIRAIPQFGLSHHSIQIFVRGDIILAVGKPVKATSAQTTGQSECTEQKDENATEHYFSCT